MGDAILPVAAQRFYRAAVIGLRVLEAQPRGARRFGGDPDVRWERFKGHLHAGDRLDLLLGDAAVTWGAAFSPARAFNLQGIADDEHFGPSWPGLSADEGRRLWREVESLTVPADPVLALEMAIKVLDLLPASEPGPVTVTPSTHLVVSGAAALRGAVRIFASRADLRWAEQVVVAADEPRQRQLAGLAGLFLGSLRPVELLGPDALPANDLEALATLRRLLGATGIDAVLLSQDATQASRDLIARIQELMRGPRDGAAS